VRAHVRGSLRSHAQVHTLDIFHAERFCCGSSFKITTSLCFNVCPVRARMLVLCTRGVLCTHALTRSLCAHRAVTVAVTNRRANRSTRKYEVVLCMRVSVPCITLTTCTLAQCTAYECVAGSKRKRDVEQVLMCCVVLLVLSTPTHAITPTVTTHSLRR
jgi:hypothetical protein